MDLLLKQAAGSKQTQLFQKNITNKFNKIYQRDIHNILALTIPLQLGASESFYIHRVGSMVNIVNNCLF